jgi:predicted dehydrogenase
VDLALWLFGDLEVRDVVSNAETTMGSETSASFTVRNSNELEGQFDISQCMLNYRMPEFGLLIECKRGKIEVNDDRLSLTKSDGGNTRFYRHDLNDNVDFFLGETEYFRENQHFVNSVLNNRITESNFEMASKVDYIIDRVRSRSY